MHWCYINRKPRNRSSSQFCKLRAQSIIFTHLALIVACEVHLKFLSEIKINFMQNVGFFSPELHMYFFVGFASVEFWQMSEEKPDNITYTCLTKTISIGLCSELELSKTIGPVSKADENLSGVRSSSKHWSK